MGGPEDTIATSDGTGLRDLRLCDTAPLRGLSVRDRMVADKAAASPPTPASWSCSGSPDEAAQVARAFSDLSSFCDSTTLRGDMETVTEVRESPFGPTPAATLLQTYTFDGEPGTGATVVHVVPVGAALLVTSTYGEWTGAALEDGVAETVDAVRQTVAAMASFDDGSADSTPSSTPSSEASPEVEESAEPTESATVAAGVPVIPDDFPLAVGLPESDGETEVSAPSADGDGMGEVEMCGRVVWPWASPPVAPAAW